MINVSVLLRVMTNHIFSYFTS